MSLQYEPASEPLHISASRFDYILTYHGADVVGGRQAIRLFQLVAVSHVQRQHLGR